jgi:hypothetical protein
MAVRLSKAFSTTPESGQNQQMHTTFGSHNNVPQTLPNSDETLNNMRFRPFQTMGRRAEGDKIQ